MATKKIPLICSGHSRPVVDFSYSPIIESEEGFFIVSACLDGKPMLPRGETGDWIGTFIGHKGAVWSAHINQTASQVATGSADYTAKVWDALSGKELTTFQHSKIVKSVHFSLDGKRLITGGLDKTLRIFDLSKPEGEPQQMEGHTQSVKQIVWSKQDPNIVISGGGDNALRIWDVRTLKEVKNIPVKSAVTSIDLSLDNKHMTATAGKEVFFYDAAKFELVKSYSLSLELNSASLAPDAQTFVVGGSSDFWARVYEFSTGKELELHKGHHGPVHCVHFAPDGATFATGSEDGTIRLWQNGEVRAYGLWQEPPKAEGKSEADQ
jgi:serine-threonine kinase receptor-associated protein